MQFSTYDSDVIFQFITLPAREKCNLFLSGCSIRMTGPERKNISFGTTGKFRPSGGSLSHLHRAYKLHNQPVLLNNFFFEKMAVSFSLKVAHLSLSLTQGAFLRSKSTRPRLNRDHAHPRKGQLQ